MTLEIGLIVASLLIFSSAALIVAAVCAVLYPSVSGWLDRLPPATRANFLFTWVTAPVWLSIVLLLLVLSPSIAHSFGFGIDHCHDHDEHIHLCVIHTPWVVGSTVEWVVLGGLVALVSIWFVVAGARLESARGKLRMLLSLSRPSTVTGAMRVVPSHRQFVFTAGMLRPQIFLSGALLDAIDSNELATVVAHEHAHRHRKDGLRLFVADLFGGLHLPPIRRRMSAHLRLAVEQACDEVAAEQSGDRLQVAETILHLTRLVGSTSHIGATEAAFTGSDAVSRIECLLRPPIPQRPAVYVWVNAFAAGLLVVGLVSSDWWHHGAETFLGYLIG